MKQFANLFSALSETNKTNDRIAILKSYFENAPEKDKIWAIYLLSGGKIKRQVNHTQLRTWAMEATGLPQWLFEECYHSVGDLSETIALLLPPPETTSNGTLSDWIEKIQVISKQSEAEKKDFLLNAWSSFDTAEKFAFNKLITGAFRIGVSEKMVINALSELTGIPGNILSHRVAGNWNPEDLTYQGLIFEDRIHTNISQPYPFYLAYPIEGAVDNLGVANEWQAEWKWDGIRGQLIIRQNEIFIWSRGEELVTDKFPELHALKSHLPDGIVLDGEIICFENGHPMPFAVLQTRIGRKNVTPKILKSAPVAFIVYDLLEYNYEDIRTTPLHARRKIIETLKIAFPMVISPEIIFDTWQSLTEKRTFSRENFAEGIMLKRKKSAYEVGRKKGNWWKWKVDPYAIDAVLIYAQKGSGRRADLYTDYTFAVWDNTTPEKKLVIFAKAYSGLTDKEIREVDNFVKRNTLEKFGPVRTVTPKLVFEIGFEGISLSGRHKSGVAVRFPRMLRWRKDKTIEEANTLDDLKGLL